MLAHRPRQLLKPNNKNYLSNRQRGIHVADFFLRSFSVPATKLDAAQIHERLGNLYVAPQILAIVNVGLSMWLLRRKLELPIDSTDGLT